uniref:major capsid family protein n=1 Tax=uncultured Bilophila sp. TaxID=529385 RepID=UPI0025F75835|nr:major capsid family protein [uncultured Bilophila sp.]
MNPTFEQAKRYGFIFPNARMWATPENRARIAQDAALITTPNTTVPAELLAYIDPMVIEILTAPRRAREIFGEEKKGDWTTPYMKWRVDEMTGKTEPYSDYANGTTSGVNSEWQTRVQYVFQTSITYGDFEVDMSSTAKVNLAASKQRAAANVIDIDQNRFYLLGVAGKEIYGILNDPNLPAAITAGATGTGGSTKWADKTTVQIYNDVLALFAQLSEQSSGLIDKDTPLKLCLSPELAVRLGAATDFNVSVLDMLKRYFTRIDIVTVPELHSMTAGETMFLIAPEVNGQRSGTLAFGEKMRAGRVVPDLSSFRQKFVGTTYGGIVLMPFAFAQMTGM